MCSLTSHDRAMHVQEKVRGLHLDLLMQACRVTHVPRMIDFVTAGLASKSSRTRVVCADTIKNIMAEFHLTMFDQQLRTNPFAVVAQVPACSVRAG